jgi:phosphoglycolate phosphatase-like HAD superfamily hydrolase
VTLGKGDLSDAAPTDTASLPSPAYWRWRGPPVNGQAVVFDLDGVLSDATERQHFVTGKRRDWDAFFDAVGDDAVIEDVARVLSLLAADVRIVLLTGRPLRVQRQTVAWLERHQLRWDLLIMRPSGDYAAAKSFKRRSIAELRAYGMQLELAFEDDRRNLEMFQAEGVPCLYIHSGYYE